MKNKIKFVILDDDPTGIQTIHGCLLLTSWEPEYLEIALGDNQSFFYILTNSRAYAPYEVKAIISGIMKNLITVNRSHDYRIVFISRSDSTLRSHFPLEINTILHFWEGEIHKKTDAIFLIPAFFEGKRITYNDTHFIRFKERDTPTDQTEFAKDSIFHYSNSYLPLYIEEKTNQQIKAKQVQSISLSQLQPDHKKELNDYLSNLQNRQMVIVNATKYEHLNQFSESILPFMKKGKTFLFQSAASFVKSLTKNPDQPLLNHKIISEKGPGLFVIGSYVHQTTLQLQKLIGMTSVVPLEIDIHRFSKEKDYQYLLSDFKKKISFHLEKNETPVVFTSRQEVYLNSKKERFLLGQKISNFLAEIVKDLNPKPAFLVAKGGITSHQILAKGLLIKQSRVLGQILPGIPVVSLPDKHFYPSLPFIIFPGNVGDQNALVDIFNKLKI
ncbi:MAG: four-carbon acid sugar kinase family protein [Candidatus Atribacteria bacterium]|nr:four-carbon acid sugar kinase family protein [Candidatus Atribacteria bacterium]